MEGKQCEDTKEGRPCDDKGRDWSCVATSQGTPKLFGSYQELGRGKDLPLEPS